MKLLIRNCKRQCLSTGSGSRQKKLPGKGSCKIRQAFRSLITQTKVINILVLPVSLELDDYIESQLISLRDSILSRGYILIIISEDETQSLGYTGQFIEDNLEIASPDILWIRCIRDQDYKASINWSDSEELHVIIRNFWIGRLCFEGPIPGWQQVNLELMRAECRNCHKPIKVVTGIVFPDRQLERWDNHDWLYYNQIIQLSEIDDEHIRVIQRHVDQLILKGPSITPINNLYTPADEEYGCDDKLYAAAICPFCNAPLEDMQVAEDRMEYLFSTQSRIDGNLEYHSIKLHVDQELIETLKFGGEGCNHTRFLGWVKWLDIPSPSLH